MSEVAQRAKPKASDEEIQAAYRSNPAGGLRGASVATRTPMRFVSLALKKVGIVSDPRAGSAQEYPDEDRTTLDTLSGDDWQYVAGVFAAQKRGVYITGNTVRVYMTISDQTRLFRLASILGVGQANVFPTNKGSTKQFIYRMSREHQVKRFLGEMQARLPDKHEWVEKGLAVLHGQREGSKDNG